MTDNVAPDAPLTEALAVTYDAEANPTGKHFPGVALADIPTAQWNRLPAWLQASVLASDGYAEAEEGAEGAIQGRGLDPDASETETREVRAKPSARRAKTASGDLAGGIASHAPAIHDAAQTLATAALQEGHPDAISG